MELGLLSSNPIDAVEATKGDAGDRSSGGR
jgi:hypothetical protein